MSNGKLTAVLLNLYKDRHSGILRLENKTEKKQLALEAGRLAFAESNLPGEHLTKIMTERKLLPITKMRDITSAIKKGKTSEAAILETPGVKPNDVLSGVAEQAITILATLWRWNDCTMNFYAGDNLISRKIKAGIPVPDAVILSARYAAAKHLFPAPNGFMEGRFELASAPVTGIGEIPFNDVEADILVHMQKPIRTVDLITTGNSRSENPEEAILSLAAIGLIRFQSPEEILMDASDPEAMIMKLENTLRQIESAGHYEVLSVPRGVSIEVLQDAYHRMARQLHPDRFQTTGFSEEIRQNAQKAFTAVNEAYFVLKDPVTRKAYDEQRFGKQ